MRVILRAEWGSRHDNGSGSAPLPASEVWLHHSVTSSPGPNVTFEHDAARIRTIEAIGESRFGTGMSYTWLITESGRVFEGHSVGRLGTHTGGRNSRARAICFVGNYDNLRPSNAQLTAAAWLLQEAKRRGWITAARLNGGHRDVKATGCPGRHAYAAIGHINALAAGPPITEEDDMPLTDSDAQLVVDKLLNTCIRRTNDPGEPPVAGEFLLRWLFAATDGHTGAIKARLDALETKADTQQAGLLAAVDRLTDAVANDRDVTPDELRQAVREAMAETVTVDVRVTGPAPQEGS
ncbi:N-acetylmuramoyl-L-alanine amidase [Kibdelosporangium philippinense]|uniref:N-acetylmuramoyl-L-alanine amidase n=1 Tax=Kibdelosporangium philippinense TaxID=211113 RepID=A0ABS8ZLQ7_9PSEU|nr:N-acetylmuramoyl-L-alanine amidase [Kibdelosporangium philippinense]MCE7008721.1 N-acetylmuramoyl-L-alanine amidase [Kibdelosporangium philippinense]